MPEPVEKEIIVKGSRPKPNAEIASGGDFSPFVPGPIAAVLWEQGIGGPEAPQRVRIFDRDGHKVFRFEQWGIEIMIPEAEWEAMTDRQQRALTFVFQHIDRSDRLEAALAHYAQEGVTEIVLRYGPTGWLHNGNPSLQPMLISELVI